MCMQTHPPLGELNATLEIVFSVQVYLAIPVDSVWCLYFSHLRKGELLVKSTQGFSRRKSCGRRGEERHSSQSFT